MRIFSTLFFADKSYKDIRNNWEFATEGLVQKELIRTLPAHKIVNDMIIFVQGEGAKPQHTERM